MEQPPEGSTAGDCTCNAMKCGVRFRGTPDILMWCSVVMPKMSKGCVSGGCGL